MSYVCRHCGCSVGFWFFGWKHQRGWRSPPSCGKALTGRDVMALEEPRSVDLYNDPPGSEPVRRHV